GVGKVVFTMTSRARTFFALTHREGSEAPILMGKNILKFHMLGQDLFQGASYFVDSWEPSHPREPISDAQVIDDFARDFGTERGEHGLSIVVPHLDPSVDVNALKMAVIAEYAYAILAGRLQVTLEGDGIVETLKATHLPHTGNAEIDAG